MASLICADSLDGIEPCDAIITDPPYSERTHAGHAGARRDPATMPDPGKCPKPIPYPHWTETDVLRGARAWAPQCKGWIVIITDHALAPVWSEALQELGRYSFAPLPAVITGSGVRLSGDGPSSWTRWIVVARPRHEPYSTWGTLPGAYVGTAERQPWIGGKPAWLMNALVRDYTKLGDLVCDPCLGGGTTAVACANLEREFRGYDTNPRAIETTEKRLRQQCLPLGGV